MTWYHVVMLRAVEFNQQIMGSISLPHNTHLSAN